VDDAYLTEQERREIRRINTLELISSILLALATIASAWSAYQATRWSGLQTTKFGEVAILRSEAARKTNIETQLVGIDVGMFILYDEALARDDRTLAGRIFQRFSPELKTATRAWIEASRLNPPQAPSSPFAMEEYYVRETERATQLVEKANHAFKQAKEAKGTGDAYIFMSIVFELVLLFSIVGMKFRDFRTKVLMLSASAAIYVSGLAVIFSFPVR